MASATAKLKYFDLSGFGGLCGRGGSVRLFLLQNGISFEEETVDWNEWGSSLKAEAIKSGESPAGHLPLLTVDGHTLCETMAILRYLSKRINSHTWAPSYGADAVRDYKVDSIADAAAEIRVAMLKSAFGSEADKKAYMTSPDQRPHFYKTLNTLVGRYSGSGPYAVANSASFADAVLFALLWDDVAVHGDDKELWGESPKLAEFYRAYLHQWDAVRQWCMASRPDLCSAAS